MVAMPIPVPSMSVKRGKHCSGRQFSRPAVNEPFSGRPKAGLGHILLLLVSPSLLSKLSAFTDISTLPVTYDWVSNVLMRMMNDVSHDSPSLAYRRVSSTFETPSIEIY
jgi:hypothetical protein